MLVQVVGEIKEGTITNIEVIETENIKYKEDDERNSESSKIYEVSDNGVYHFRITASTGRSYMASITVANAAPFKKDLITGIGDINESGFKMIKVKGKTKEVDPTIEEVEETELYTLDVIYHEGDLILKNGSFTLDENKNEKAVTVDGLSLASTTWSVRKSRRCKQKFSSVKSKWGFNIRYGLYFNISKEWNGGWKRIIYILYRNSDNKWNSKYERCNMYSRRAKCVLMEK